MRKGEKSNKPAWNANPIYRDCLICGETFRTILAKVKVGKGKYCSKKCYLEAHSQNVWTTGVCLGCGENFEYMRKRNQTCCSLRCNTQWKKKKNENKKYSTSKCLQCGVETKILKSREKDNRGKFCCRKCYAEWMSINRINEKCPSWKGGLTPLYKKIRTLARYQAWRNAILEKDHYQCVLCGEINKSSIIADHIVGMAQIMSENHITTATEAKLCGELWDLQNGRALCKKCHSKTENYGYGGWVK